jgi:hypothetical protein
MVNCVVSPRLLGGGSMLEEIAGNEESLTVVCVSVVSIVAILVFGFCGTLVSLVKQSSHNRLKQQMLERGMSPLEIEQVLKAGSDDFKSKWHPPKNPPVRSCNSGSASPAKASP